MGSTYQRVIHSIKFHKHFTFYINCIVNSLVTKLMGHTAELSNCVWNFDESMIGTSSIDATARIWDVRNVNSCHIIDGHNDEVLDICFSYTGKIVATCSNDCTGKIWNTQTDFGLIATMAGHSGEVSKVRCYSYL